MSQVHQSTGPQGKTPVSWPMLGILGVAAAASVSYYRIQRERRLEEAMGKIVTSESNSDENLKEGAWVSIILNTTVKFLSVTCKVFAHIYKTYFYY